MKIVSNEFDGRESIMGSIEIDDYSCLGIGRGWKSSYGWCQGFFDPEQVSHDSAHFFKSLHILGHHKFLDTSFKVLIESPMSGGKEVMAYLKNT